jgi:transposase
MTNSLFIGVDVSLQSNQICVLNFDQHKFFNLKFPNTPDGCEEAIGKIKNIYDKFYFDKIIVVCEATGMYSLHLACYFSSHEFLNNFNTEVYQINAHDFAKYKDSFSDIEKTDPSDAYILADFARVGRTKPLHPFRGSQYIALQRLTRQRYHISKNLVKEKLYVMNNIYLSFSGLIIADKKNKPFSNMFGATSCAIFDNFDSPDQIAETPVDSLLDLISKVGKNRTKNPNEKIDLLNKAVRSSYRLDQTAYNGINIAVASSLSTIRFLENELKQVDKAILDTVNGLNSNAYNSLLSIRGIGKVYAAGILAEIGSIDYFKHNSNLAKYAGLYWNRTQSGKFEKEDKKFSQHANKYLRYYLIEATASCVRINFPFIKNFYDSKFKEVTKHQHKRALVLSARKLVRLIFGLLRKNQYYSPLDSNTQSLIN